MTEPIRIAISGAAGRIGYALVFRMAAGGVFGRDQPVSLSLLDVPDAVPILQANEMELKDSAFPLLEGLSISSDPVKAFKDADWVILLGGHPLGRKYTNRIDLVRENGPIFVDHGRAINQACPSARILVVANPCNTNCLIAAQHAPNVPREHWFAMNRLDWMRATSLIAHKAEVSVAQVNRVNIWG
ncbi:MAG TPA: malate dehydrogenase, partial [Isosphaeraceae bacterium]|nr:malate dehydrogenase [Isosphaeraceae bacterium]